MKKIDYYILREFSITFLFVSLFFTLISLIVDIFENLNKFIDNEVTSSVLVEYYIAAIPSMISVTIPVTCLVASVFTYGMMVQKKEWLVPSVFFFLPLTVMVESVTNHQVLL